MDLNSMLTEVIPTMIISWIFVMLFIVTILQIIKRFRIFKKWLQILSDPKLNFERHSFSEWTDGWIESFRQNFLAAPNNLRLAIQSAWRGRERGLAIFSGVFLASLVTVSYTHLTLPTKA